MIFDLGKLKEPKDIKDKWATFTTGDTENPIQWKDVPAVREETENTVSVRIDGFFNKITTMFQNIRFLKSQYDVLNSNLTTTIETITTSSGNAYLYRCGKIRVLSMSAAKNNEIILSEDDIPPSIIYGVCTYLDGNTWKYDALVNINSNGVILCTKIGIEHLNTMVTGSIMWIVD